MTVALVLLMMTASGCRSNKGSASAATITVKESRAAITFGARRADLPEGDVEAEAPVVVQDEAGRKLAYRTSKGAARILYVLGEGLFAGPLVAHPADFGAVPDLDHALGPLFEAAGSRRAELVREVHREKGDGGVVRLLIDAAYVDDPAWEDARKQLSSAAQDALRDGLASGLEPGKSGIMLRRAVSVLDLRAPSRASLVATRAKELAGATDEPRAVAALLRAVIANDKAKAGEIGCDVLAKMPPGDDPAQASLVEAATLAVAVADASCADPKLVESLLVDACLPYYRCSERGPVSWSETSKQDEPLCDKTQLEKVIRSEIDRTTRDVLESTAARPALFAYASLVNRGRLPPSFVTAHARRRYAVAQSAEPVCDIEVLPGTSCHCDEATLRLYACKQAAAGQIHVSTCRFEVNDEQKKIHKVVATAAP